MPQDHLQSCLASWLQNLEQERAALVDRAHRVLDEIERLVLRTNPSAALLMLTEFLEGNEKALWRSRDDSGLSQVLARAVALARTAATNLPPEEWRAVRERPGVRH